MSARRVALSAVLVTVPAAVVVAVLLSPPRVQLAVGGLLAAGVAAWVGLRHPLAYFWALAIALGAVPFGDVPLTPVPLVLLLAGACVLATVLHPTAVGRTTPLEVAIWLLIATSTIAFIATGRSGADALEFAKWLIGTLLAVALLRLDRRDLARFGRLFVYAASAGAAFALVIRVADPQARLIRLLAVFGYEDPVGSRFVYYAEGAKTLRLGGAWLDPNAAGIFLFVALVLCALLLRGGPRLALGALLLVALVLTLSRATMASVLGAVLLLLVFQQMRDRERRVIAGSLLLAAVAALALPTVRDRLVTSFGSSDVGSSARLDALRDFPDVVAGHWVFGLGWGIPQFTDGATSFLSNFPANAPLLSLVRGGVLVGIAFVVVLVVGSVMGYQLLRTPSWELGTVGAGFIAFSLVALQLDFPVVTIPPVTTVFSVLLAFVAAAWEQRPVVSPDAVAAVARRPGAESGHATAAR